LSIQFRTVRGVAVFSELGEHDTADLICAKVSQALGMIQEHWDLGTPEECRINVMTSWMEFFFQSVPWTWRIILAITLPFWYFRAKRNWPYNAA
jgi:hypothetical protein